MNKQDIARILFDSKAVFINMNDFFTWSSGIKSPIYCDNRVLISFPEYRKVVARELAKLIANKYNDLDSIAATATGAIAHGAWVSDILNKPMNYILSKSKTHGRCKMIEGNFKSGDRVVILEDLISTGQSALNVVDIAVKHGLKVLGCVSIFSYGFRTSFDNFKNANIDFESLITVYDLLEYALSCNLISKHDQEYINNWITNEGKI